MEPSINIVNPYLVNNSDTYNCFGCSPKNPIGLKLSFVLTGDELIAKWLPLQQFDGYHNVVHGGIQSVLLDEIAGWYVNAVVGQSGVTKNMSVNYHAPLASNSGEVTVMAQLIEQSAKEVVVKGTILNAQGKLCTSALVTYAIFPVEMAKKRLKYPGKEAFFPNSKHQEK